MDRGLPISNLNNAAGGNRSNVAWADDPVPWFYGDNFQLAGGSGSIYSIDTIRTWAVSTAPNVTALQSVFNTGVTLFTGTGTTLSATPASLTITPTAYAGAQNYQSFGGETRFIYQLDFTGLSIVATGGTTISFGVEGTGTDAPSWYNHASNAALSGAIPQDSADDLMAEYSWTGTIGDAPVYSGCSIRMRTIRTGSAGTRDRTSTCRCSRPCLSRRHWPCWA
ncbi:MAG: hypothetical protein WDN25_18950 [Acetobacteraceae bacterium]